MTYLEFIESIAIFGKYAPNDLDSPIEIYSERAEMWLGPQSNIVTDDDKARLKALGWDVEPEGSFHLFV